METVVFITEPEARTLITREYQDAKKVGQDNVKNLNGFVGHLISTGSIAEHTARAILKRHPSLGKVINPDLMRVTGFMHDIGKIWVGSAYHEITGAHYVLTQGEAVGLVQASDTQLIKELLLRMSSCILSSEYVGRITIGDNFPNNSPYPKYITKDIIKKVATLQKELSQKQRFGQFRELAIPNSLEKLILIYADFSNLEGRELKVQERIDELVERYKKLGKREDEEAAYYRVNAKLYGQERAGIIALCGIVEQLATS